MVRMDRMARTVDGGHGGYIDHVQVVTGMFQATGWPGVVSVMANWFGKGRRSAWTLGTSDRISPETVSSQSRSAFVIILFARGLIMGFWNSHTSLGNILGSLIAGAFVQVAEIQIPQEEIQYMHCNI